MGTGTSDRDTSVQRRQIAFFGSSLVSAYWNGAATYYRGILRALADRGHRIRFFEPDAYDRQKHRDIADPEWAEVIVYAGDDPRAALRALQQAEGADLLVKASGVGVYDELLEREILSLRSATAQIAFWDVDAPATLERMRDRPADPFRELVPRYDVVFTYGGGPPVVSAYESFGARACVPIYNALDPATHHPAPPDPRFSADCSLLANRLPDREARIEEFFFGAAARRPDLRFVLGGNGWDGRALPSNVHWVGHVYTRDHNSFNASARAVLNVNRDSMARFGFSPATRVFEAAGAGACLITDAFVGVEQFLTPGEEILVARDGAEVAAWLGTLTTASAHDIGARARARVLRDHTYAQRAVEVERVLGGLPGWDEHPAIRERRPAAVTAEAAR